MHADAYGLRADARVPRVFGDDVAIDRTGIEVFVERSRAVVFDRTEEGTVQIFFRCPGPRRVS
jgi:hypothetical protein